MIVPHDVAGDGAGAATILAWLTARKKAEHV
jgi:hypothetical protein